MEHKTIHTYDAWDLSGVKEACNNLINDGKNFEVKLIVDINNKPTHWEIII